MTDRDSQLVVCPRCKGKNSDRCEQGGQACTDCDGKGVVKRDAIGWDGKPVVRDA